MPRVHVKATRLGHARPQQSPHAESAAPLFPTPAQLCAPSSPGSEAGSSPGQLGTTGGADPGASVSGVACGCARRRAPSVGEATVGGTVGTTVGWGGGRRAPLARRGARSQSRGGPHIPRCHEAPASGAVGGVLGLHRLAPALRHRARPALGTERPGGEPLPAPERRGARAREAHAARPAACLAARVSRGGGGGRRLRRLRRLRRCHLAQLCDCGRRHGAGVDCGRRLEPLEPFKLLS